MRHVSRALFAVALIALGTAAYCQETTLLAQCLGAPRAAYAKAFEDKTTWKKQTPQGTVIVGQYKTGSAMVEAIQTSHARVPDEINVFFYQEPKRDWKAALKSCGLSAAGVSAKTDSKGQVRLKGIKVGKPYRAEAVFIQMGPKTPDGPELHINLKK
jgi:Flp pilus assembly protein CpaB